MSAQRRPKTEFTEEEYYRLEEGSEIKHEFFQGQIFPMGEWIETRPSVWAMAGASPRHNDISLAAATSLRIQLRGSSCIPRHADQRVKVDATQLLTYPDVVVACQPLRYDAARPHTLLDATVIIEVLSPSTADYDRGMKFENYRHLPSFRHYILINQDYVEVEHRYLEKQTGEWRSERFSSLRDVIHLEAIGCTLTLSEIYDQVEF